MKRNFKLDLNNLPILFVFLYLIDCSKDLTSSGLGPSHFWLQRKWMEDFVRVEDFLIQVNGGFGSSWGLFDSSEWRIWFELRTFWFKWTEDLVRVEDFLIQVNGGFGSSWRFFDPSERRILFQLTIFFYTSLNYHSKTHLFFIWRNILQSEFVCLVFMVYQPLWIILCQFHFYTNKQFYLKQFSWA